MLAESMTLMSGIKAAIDMAKTLNAVRDNVIETTAVSDLTNQLIDIRIKALDLVESQSSLLEKIKGLQAEIERLNAWNQDSSTFQTLEVAEGVFVYVEKTRDTKAKLISIEKYCCNCFEQKTKSLLQHENEPGLEGSLTCPRCKNKMKFRHYIGAQL